MKLTLATEKPFANGLIPSLKISNPQISKTVIFGQKLKDQEDNVSLISDLNFCEEKSVKHISKMSCPLESDLGLYHLNEEQNIPKMKSTKDKECFRASLKSNNTKNHSYII